MLVMGIAAAGCGSTSPPSSAKAAKLTPVDLRLDFIAGGEEVPFAYGVDSGIYKKYGLDVKWAYGAGSGNTTELVAANQVQFGVGDGVAVTQLDAKGEGVKMVMGYVQKTPLALICSSKSGIKSPAGLAGKKIGAVAGASSLLLLPAYLHGVGLSPSQVHIVNMAGSAQEDALFTGSVDCILNYAYLIQPEMAAKGLQTVAFEYANAGVNPLNLGVVVSNKTLQNDPKLVQRFVQATQVVIKQSELHPVTAVKDLINDSHGTAPAQSILLKEFRDTMPLFSTSADQGHPLGWMASTDWQKTEQLAQTYLGLQNAPSLSTLYTDQYVK